MLEKMLHHKLLKEGEPGQGVVTERHDQAVESGTSFHVLFEIQGHIKFPDGTESAFKSEWLNSHNVGGDIQAGTIVPVRYDASDRSKVVVDVVALEEKHKAALEQDAAWLEQQKTSAIADADAEAARANADHGTVP
jgi:hypothetical protein